MSQTFLEMITAQKRAETAARSEGKDIAAMAERAGREKKSRPYSLSRALSRTDRINVIAEIKRASPSRGVINDGIDITSLAQAYERGHAAAISVLTEPEYFGGSLADLRAARASVVVPLLRKDFIVDPLQIYEAAEAGADAVLLIAAALHPSELSTLRHIAEDQVGLDALVEVHTSDELQTAIAAGATIVGVNNRDLHSLEVSLDVSRELIRHKPKGILMVAESGLSDRSELTELAEMGYDGFLVGETLMRSGDAEHTLSEWTKPRERPYPRIKICGITTLTDALLAIESGADEIGFNFYPKSPRYIDPAFAAAITTKLPEDIGRVGVFVNEDADTIANTAGMAMLDTIQLHGDEDDLFVRSLRERAGLRVIKAIRIGRGTTAHSDGRYSSEAVLLDTYSSSAPGGTGATFDWDLAKQFEEQRVYLAGGLSPDNVAEAIRSVRPFAVDVCSGVESVPGRKDPEKLRRFVKAVKEAG